MRVPVSHPVWFLGTELGCPYVKIKYIEMMFFLVLHVRQEVTDEPTAFLVLLNNPYTPKYNLNVSDLKIFFFS